jgi:hypothetical protein
LFWSFAAAHTSNFMWPQPFNLRKRRRLITLRLITNKNNHTRLRLICIVKNWRNGFGWFKLGKSLRGLLKGDCASTTRWFPNPTD